MQYLNIVLALAAAVSAIDIQGHAESHCRDARVIWRNVQANSCQSNGGVFAAFSFNSIPTNWKIVTRSYTSTTCAGNKLVNQFDSNGRDWVCHGADANYQIQYSGAGYSFINNKKRSDVDNVAGQECQKPDLLTLNDGQTYTITGVQDEIVQEMVSAL
jgi:hypothetical protein